MEVNAVNTWACGQEEPTEAVFDFQRALALEMKHSILDEDMLEMLF